MNGKVVGGLLILLFSFACQGSWQKKINFDLDTINEDGLTGPADGLVSVAYEFCIPRDKSRADEVRRIDPSVVIHERSRGRIGCSEEEYLCLGNTHQPGFRKLLRRLAGLDYVEKIERTFFE